ncbi:MAG TPA: ABC transporter substrate-binding protein [Streptosporangiaceae bacterium]|nr:ABC transporter substrate-binding protein [Streptosporangiaceae bacterium]
MHSRRRLHLLASSLAAAGLVAAGCASSGNASAVSSGGTITVGTLYAGTGNFAQVSVPEYQGLQFWAKNVNATGGVYVAPLKRKEQVKIVAYNDQSDPTTAATLYNQLITQNHADVLVADFGSVLTAPAVTIAGEQHHLLFDVTGSGTSFFSSGPNPYVVLTSLPVSAVWPKPLGALLLHLKAKRVAILYGQNDFDAAQAAAVKGFLAAGGVTPVYYQGVPTTQSDYSSLLASIKAKNPDAVLEFGYPNNDIAFLNEVKALGMHFPFLLTVFPGQGPAPFEASPGASTMTYTYTYAAPPILAVNKVNSGLGLDAFLKAFAPGKPASSVSFLSIAGYNAGLAIQAAFAHATSMSQLGIRAGVTAVNGKLQTLEGTFQVNDTGAQVGELLPVAQAFPTGSGFTFKIVYPASPSQTAQSSPAYPAPAGH